MLTIGMSGLIEGVLTCFLGVVAYIYLPHNAASPKVFFNFPIKLFSERQGTIIVTRVLRNDPSKALRYGKPVLPSHIIETFTDWKLYGHLVSAFLTMYGLLLRSSIRAFKSPF